MITFANEMAGVVHKTQFLTYFIIDGFILGELV